MGCIVSGVASFLAGGWGMGALLVGNYGNEALSVDADTNN